MFQGMGPPTWLIVLGAIVATPIYLAWLTVMVPSAAYDSYRKHKQKKPRVRKRALTLPLPDSSSPWRRRQKTFDQAQSPFFQLPMEIRRMIYHQVMMPSNGADLYVAITDHRQDDFSRADARTRRQMRQRNIWQPLFFGFGHAWMRPYDETYYWNEACDVISKMRGVEDLRISFTSGMRGSTDLDDINKLVFVLKPLMVVQQVSNFNVDIYWPIPVDQNELQDRLGGGNHPFASK
ncbi:hypothetical protein N7481_013029 [Penicillium waksmanii]|uniref:uncharacterized protein n=1 Tax=Penicillium waksmanii TaxID=69791 RepID=UPI002548CF72|nr:uncharacterized protein N7481_013029 [Penicillium waksmanii]KAJ5966315.1 hypothetical protein N7481_013029 [Penicillium waksmanii]